jgi:hypothetical protein
VRENLLQINRENHNVIFISFSRHLTHFLEKQTTQAKAENSVE